MTMLNKDRLSTDLSHKYWLTELKENLNTSNLPNDYPRQSKNREYNEITVDLVQITSSQLHDISELYDCSSYEVALSTLFILLMRYTGQVDIFVGAFAILKEDGVSHKLNPVLLSIQLDPESLFSNVVNSVKASITGVAQHCYCPVSNLDIPFNEELESSIAVTLLWKGNTPLSDRPANQNDLAAMLNKFPNSEIYMLVDLEIGYLKITILYNDALFNASTIERFTNHLGALLNNIVHNIDLPINQIPILPEAEARQILVEFNNTSIFYPDVLLQQLFTAQVQKTPSATAVLFEDQALTYEELDKRTNQLAHYLQSKGVQPDSMVGVCMDRSLEMVIALYAILKAGGAYVPIDPRYPIDRINFIIEDTNIPLLLTQQRWLEMVNVMNTDALVVAVDIQEALIIQQPNTPPPINITTDNLAYVIYTSGSTGQPKGVMNSHRGIVNRLLWMQDEYGLTTEDSILQKTPYSFDVSVWEFFWPLFIGARMVVAKPEGHKDPNYLIDIIKKYNVTTLHFVPSMLQIFVNEPRISECSSIRRVICSGEALTAALQQRFFTKLTTELHNLYGPTEAAVDVTYWQCNPDDTRDFVPIGRPVANTQIYIVDERNQLVPIGVPGELLIGGIQVARGYLNRPELTAQCFLEIEIPHVGIRRVYRTGDRCRWLTDGNIEYLGRLDFQVKLRGFRIELGEIEAVVRQHDNVQETVVMVQNSRTGDQQLIGYIVPNVEPAPTISELRDFTHAKLPEYMVPTTFIKLDGFPLSANGKINRHALPNLKAIQLDLDRAYTPPRTSTEKQMVMIWEKLLQVENIGVHDDFFELGGNSLLVIKAINIIREQFELNLAVHELFAYRTVRTLTKRIDETGLNECIEQVGVIDARAQKRREAIARRKKNILHKKASY